MVRNTRSTNLNNVGPTRPNYYAQSYRVLEQSPCTRSARRQATGSNPGTTTTGPTGAAPNPGAYVGGPAAGGPVTGNNQAGPQIVAQTTVAQRTLMDVLQIGEINLELASHLDRRAIYNLRATGSRMRNAVPDINCWNRDHPGYGYTMQAQYPLGATQNPNPWSESFSLPIARRRCNNQGNLGTGHTIGQREMKECNGADFLPSVRRRGHGPNFWCCDGCVYLALVQYTHTVFPVWFHSLCLPCSQAERLVNDTGRCECILNYSPSNGLWFCSDCRQEYSAAVYRALLVGAERMVPVRDDIRPPTDILRWIAYGRPDREFCRCGKTWAQTLQSYPADPRFFIGRDLTELFRKCLVCSFECDTRLPDTTPD